jgi:DNA polymerase-1
MRPSAEEWDSVLDGINVHYVDNLDEAQAFLRWLGERRPVLAVDTETRKDFKWWTPNFVRLVQFGDGMTGWSISLRLWRWIIERALEVVRDTQVPVVFHNAKFDLHALEGAGLALPAMHRVHDTMIMSHLVDPLTENSLKGLSRRMFGPEAVAGQDMLKIDFSNNGWDWDTIPEDRPSYWAYAALDTVLTARAAETLLHQTQAEPYDREMAVQSILYRAERRGMRVDPAYTGDLRLEWLSEAEDLRARLVAAGIENPNSNVQVIQVLEAAGWEPNEWTETGQPKLDKAVLAEVSTVYGDIAAPLVRYKRLTKWTSTYLDTFLTRRDTNDHVHASINTFRARTGRMSITGPPLQTLPRGSEIRNCVIPDDGHSIWSIDYANMELRVFAHDSGDEGLISAFQAGEDIHTYSAAQAYGVEKDEVSPEQRQTAKNTNFARIYGAGPAKIATTAGTTEAEIRGYIRSFDARFPRAPLFMRELERTAKMRAALEGEPYIITTGGRRVPQTMDKIYALLNYRIQGSCADMFKDAIIRLDRAGLGDRIIVPVHDEVLFQFPEGDEGAEMAHEAHEVMEDRDSLAVPLTCDVAGPMPRWDK